MNPMLITLFLSSAFAANAPKLDIKSSAFQNGGRLPAKYTCESLNISPPLSWTGVPDATKTYVLICEDPDAPSGSFIHWVIFNIPKEKKGLEENIPRKDLLSDGTAQGRNGGGRIGYAGPCPPPGKPHRYFFRLYCLDVKLSLTQAAKADVDEAMKEHVLAEAQIMGTYQR